MRDLKIRPARADDLPLLQSDIARDKRWEQVDLTRGIVFVVEKDGEITTYGQARLVWQIEPIKHRYGMRKKLSYWQAKKATYLTIKALDDWIADRTRNTTGIYSYFCFIRNRVMQRLAVAFGMMTIYEGGKFFGRDT